MHDLIVLEASCLGGCGELQLTVRWRTASDEAYPRHCRSRKHSVADEIAAFRTATSSFVKIQCAVRLKCDVVAGRQCSVCGEGCTPAGIDGDWWTYCS